MPDQFNIVHRMQTIRSGSSIGNEVARRLNACEEKNLQKEVSRFEKEHEKRMREFFNERYAVRQAMRGFKIDNVKSAFIHKGSRAQKNDIEKIKPNSIQAWRVPLEQNDSSIVNSSAKIKNLEVPKRQRKLIRSSSVPNLYQPACVATSKEASHDKEHDPGTNNTNAIARQRVSKPCQWMTVGELNDKKESMEKGFENTDLSFPDSVYQTKSTPQQSINGNASFMNDVSNAKRVARHKRPKTSLPTRCQMYKEINTADGFFEDKSIQRILSPTEKKRTKSDVITPFLDVDKSREQGSNCDPRPKTSLQVRYHHQKENILSQQKQQHGNVKTSLTFHVSKDAHNSIHNHRPLSSCSLSKVNVSSVKFLTVSETVIATQKLIKSYRRQQAIEKATQEIKSKQKTSNSTKADSAQTLQAKPKFKGVVNAVMAVNAFKRNLKIMQK